MGKPGVTVGIVTEVREPLAVEVETARASTLGPHPKHVRTIFEDGRHVVVREAVGVPGGVVEENEGFIAAVEKSEAVLRPHPEITLGIDKQGVDRVFVRQRISLRFSTLIRRIGVKAHSSCPDPNPILRIQRDGGYRDRGGPEPLERFRLLIPSVQFPGGGPYPDVRGAQNRDRANVGGSQRSGCRNERFGVEVQHIQAGFAADPKKLLVGNGEVGDVIAQERFSTERSLLEFDHFSRLLGESHQTHGGGADPERSLVAACRREGGELVAAEAVGIGRIGRVMDRSESIETAQSLIRRDPEIPCHIEGEIPDPIRPQSVRGRFGKGRKTDKARLGLLCVAKAGRQRQQGEQGHFPDLGEPL